MEKYMSDQESVNQLFGVESDKKEIASLPKLSDTSLRTIASEEKKPFYTNIFLQLAVACGGFFIGAMILKAVFLGGDNKSQVAQQAPIPPVVGNTANPYEDLTKENAQLKTALGKNQQEQFVQDKTRRLPKGASTTPQNVVAVRQLPVIQRVASPPEIRYVDKIVYKTVPAQESISPPVVASMPRFYPSTPQQIPSDPEKVIQNLGDKIVVEGSAPVTATPAVFNTSNPNEGNVYPVAQVPDGESPYPSVSNATPVAMNARTMSTLPSGSEGRGELTVPIVAPNGIDISQDEFPIKVTKAIGDIPKGAVLIASAEASNAGFFRLKPVRIYKDGQELPLPDNLVIRARSGSPLIEAKIKKPGSGFNLLTPLLSAVRGIATNAISSNTSSVNSNGFSSYSSSTRQDPFAAAGAGLADGLLSNLQNRAGQVQNSQSSYSLVSEGTEFKLVAQ
jgi:hypothetical protein